MTLPHDCKVTCCAFNAQRNQDDNDPLIVVCDVNGTITTWDLEEATTERFEPASARQRDYFVLFFPGQPLLMTSAKDNSLKQWAYDQSDGSSRLLKFRCGHGKPPNLVSFYADGKRIFASGGDKSLSVVDDPRSAEQRTFAIARRISSQETEHTRRRVETTDGVVRVVERLARILVGKYRILPRKGK